MCSDAVRSKVVMDCIRDVGDCRPMLERERLAVDLAALAEMDADQAGEPENRIAKLVEARVVEDRDRNDLEARHGRRQCGERTGSRLVALRPRHDRRLVDAGGRKLGSYRLEIVDRLRERVAEHDRIRAAKHTEKRTTAAAVLRGALDQAGISTSCTWMPQIVASAGTGRSVVNA